MIPESFTNFTFLYITLHDHWRFYLASIMWLLRDIFRLFYTPKLKGTPSPPSPQPPPTHCARKYLMIIEWDILYASVTVYDTVLVKEKSLQSTIHLEDLYCDLSAFLHQNNWLGYITPTHEK